jgi:hypothetical protein
LDLAGHRLSMDTIRSLVEYEYEKDESVESVAKALAISVRADILQMAMNLVVLERYVYQLTLLSGKVSGFKLDLQQIEYWDRIVNDKIYKTSDCGWRTYEQEDNPHPIEIKYKIGEWLSDMNRAIVSSDFELINIADLVREFVGWQPLSKSSQAVGYYLLYLCMTLSGYDKYALLAMSASEYKSLISSKFWQDRYVKYLADEVDVLVSKIRGAIMGRLNYKLPTVKSRVLLSDRESVLIDAMKQDKLLTVRGARSYIPYVSDDTILRELNSLVKKGIARKKGSTRGAHYILIKKNII